MISDEAMIESAKQVKVEEYKKNIEKLDRKIRNIEIGIFIQKFSVSIFGGDAKLVNQINTWIETMEKHSQIRQLLFKIVYELTGELTCKDNSENEYEGTLSHQMDLLEKEKILKQKKRAVYN